MLRMRALALPLLEAKDDRAAYLALKDPDADNRRKALAMFAGAGSEPATAALSDDDEKVQATALAHLNLPLDNKLQDTLAPNMLAWLAGAGTDLATASATLLPILLAAAHAIVNGGLPDRVERIAALLANGAQQVRGASERPGDSHGRW